MHGFLLLCREPMDRYAASVLYSRILVVDGVNATSFIVTQFLRSEYGKYIPSDVRKAFRTELYLWYQYQLP